MPEYCNRLIIDVLMALLKCDGNRKSFLPELIPEYGAPQASYKGNTDFACITLLELFK